jgi:glycosidase
MHDSKKLLQSTPLHRAVTALLVALLILVALPLNRLRAQGDGLSEEERGLVQRAIAGILAANDYTSYELDSDFHVYQSWTGTIKDEVQNSQILDMTSREQSRAVMTGSGPNIWHNVALNMVSSGQGVPTVDFTLNGELRQVDGRLYAQAAYTDSQPDQPKVPAGWVILDDAGDLDIWPGLAMFINANAYFSSDANAAFRPFYMSAAGIQTTFEQYTTSASSAPGTLEDGTAVEVITLALTRDAAVDMGMFSREGPENQIIFDAIPGSPLSGQIYLNDQGQVVGIDYVFKVELPELDLTWSPNVPAGYTIELTIEQTLAMRLSNINADLELVAAPEMRAQESRPGFAPPAPPQILPWWNDRVFYEIFVRSFYDSDGDGIGDLQGVIQKLDYLNDGDPATTTDLGVTGLWLMPVAQSPSYHGYDVIDYYTVEEDYGTNQDFKDLVAAAHERGMVVIVDLVMNHTSSEHPWFEASMDGDPAYQDWYLWSDTDPGTRAPWGAPAWHSADGRYFYGLFWEGMPDLNYNDPAVTDEMFNVIQFWLQDMGADGFRLDAIRHLYEEGDQVANVPATFEWLKTFHDYVRSINENALTVGEVWDLSENVVPYVGDKVDICFEFDFAEAIIDAAMAGNKDPLIYMQGKIIGLYPPAQYATFLTNHDQNRVIDQVVKNQGSARVAASVLLTSPGVPFIYYGEEIGMSGSKPDERIRTPMQWDDSRLSGGFSTTTAWQTMGNGYRQVNVAAQTDDPASLLNHYRHLVQLRNEHPALRTDAIQLIESSHRGVYSFLRYAEGETLLVIINLAKKPVEDYTLSATDTLLRGDVTATLLFGEGGVNPPALDENGGFGDYVPLNGLPAQSTFVIALQ